MPCSPLQRLISWLQHVTIFEKRKTARIAGVHPWKSWRFG